jgi:hypothetical protein
VAGNFVGVFILVAGGDDVDVVLEVLGIWGDVVILHPSIQNMDKAREVFAERKFVNLMAEIEMSDELFMVSGLEVIKLKIAAHSQMNGRGHFFHVELGIDFAAFGLLRRRGSIGFVLALPEDVIAGPLRPATCLEGLSHILATCTAIVLIKMALEARAASQMRSHMWGPDRSIVEASFFQFCRILADVGQAVADPHAKLHSSLREALLVDVMSHMHHVCFLGIDQVHMDNGAWNLEKSDFQRNVEILLVLVLVDQHLILRLQLEKVSKLRDEKKENDKK